MSKSSTDQGAAATTSTTGAPDQSPRVTAFSRRNVLAVGAIGVAGVALAACSSGSNTTAASPSTDAASSGAAPDAPGAAGALIVSAADVPVGSATLAEANGSTWLVAQPSAGDIVCHSGICTHEGCPLTQVDGDKAICMCHNSQFDVFTGAVIQSPALRALSPQSVTVSNGDVFLG
ncbi:MAG: Rieske (2Fe-2S) protein [Actinobacteria bacterium]|nr:Rieske (2Fe-2S) protein [Actinomycetota bacterium]